MACTWPARSLFSNSSAWCFTLAYRGHVAATIFVSSCSTEFLGKRTTRVTALYQSLPLFVKARVGPQDYNVVMALIKSLKLLNCFSQPIYKTGTWPCADCCLCEYGHGLCAWSSLGFIRAFPQSIPLQLLALL